MTFTFKRIVSLFLCLSMLLVYFPAVYAASDANSCGNNLTWAFNESSGVLTISGNGEMNYFSYREAPWYSLRESIKSVVFDGEISGLGGYAFLDCTALEEITIPESVENLGSCTFECCTNLTSANILSTRLWLLDSSVFNGCDNLSGITISENCEDYKSVDGIVYTKDGGTLVCYPAGRKTASFEIPEDVYAIRMDTFRNHHFLQEIIMHENVSNIEEGFVCSCPQLSSIVVDDNNEYYTAVDNVLFTKDMKTLLCYAEAKVGISYTVPEGVERIGDYAFYDTNVEEFDLPDSVCTIGAYAFSYGAWWKNNYTTENATHNGTYLDNHLLDIPRNAESFTVKDGTKSIATYAGAWRNNMTEVTLPDSLEYIGNAAFYGSNRLAVVNLGEGLISIGDEAFRSTGLTGISLPDSVEYIGNYAFDNTPMLQNSDLWGDDALYIGKFLIKAKPELSGDYVVKDGTRVISSRAFYDCSSVESVTLPDSVEIIEDEIFSWRSVLKNIPKNIKHIGDSAYRYSSGYFKEGNLTLPEGLTYIGANAFEIEYGDEEIKNLSLPASLEYVGDEAFSRCSLKSITIKSPNTVYGRNVFSNNYELKSVTFPNGLERIQDSWFYGCSLETLFIPKSIKYLGKIDFGWGDNCIFYPGTEEEWNEIELVEGNNFDTVTVYYNFAPEGSCGDNAQWSLDVATGTLTISGTGSTEDYSGSQYSIDVDTPWKDFSDLIETVVIEEGITAIGTRAFKGCTELKKVYIPSTLERFNGETFSGCLKIEAVYAESWESWLSIVFDYVSYSLGSYMYEYVYDSNPISNTGAKLYIDNVFDTSVVIPDGITAIYDYVFEDCTWITSVTFPKTLVGIGEYAFEGCTGIKSITIPKTVAAPGTESAAVYIEDFAFANCTGLKNISFSETVSVIGESAFEGCTGITSLTLPSGEHIDVNAFAGCSSLETATIFETVTTINANAFSGCTNLTINCHPGTAAEQYATENGIPCDYIWEGSLFDWQMSETGALRISGSGKMPTAKYAKWYESKDKITSVTIEDGVTSVASSAFSDCKSLTNADIPDSITSIDNYAFSGCEKLESVIIPDSVETIGYQAFYGCSSLKEVYIFSNATQIESFAFSNYDNITIYCYPGSNAEQYAIAHGIPYTYISTLEELSIKLNITDESENIIDGGFTVNWYEKGSDDIIATGKKLSNYDENKEYEFEVILSEALSYTYYQPARQAVVLEEGADSINLILEEICKVSVAGTVTDEEAAPVANATVTFNQTYNGEYEKKVTVTTNSDGAFSASISNVPTTASISAPGCYSDNVTVIANRTSATTIAINDVILAKLPENKITLSLSKTAVKIGNETPLTTVISSVEGIEFAVKNLTSGNNITYFEVQYPNLIIGDTSVNGGDEIEITAIDTKGAMTAAPVTLTLDVQKMGSCSIEFIENGYIEGTDIVGNPENYVFVFDKDGSYVDTYNAKPSFTSKSLASGEYTLAFIKKVSVLRNVKNLSKLAVLGLAEGTDYVTRKITVEAGEITGVDGVVVPVLDESKLYYAVKEKTHVKSSSKTAVAGRYIVIRAEYEIDSKHFSDDEMISIELPEGMRFTEGSLSFNGKPCAYTIDGNTITVRTNTSAGTLRFYVYATNAGEKNINTYLSFDNGGAEITQPLGTATIEIENSKISVPESTSRETVTITGLTLPGSVVTIYDNDICVGTATANKAGTWSAAVNLAHTGEYSYHYIRASIAAGDDVIITDKSLLVYDKDYVGVSTITMINQAHPEGALELTEYTTVFDFINPKPMAPYLYWPEYPDFTFKVEFDGDSSKFEDVSIVAETLDDDTVYIPLTYDSNTDLWIGTHSFYSPAAIPTSVGAVWNDDRISVPVDPSDADLRPNSAFEEFMDISKESAELERLIEEESQKENPDYEKILGPREEVLTPEEKESLIQEYSELSLNEFELEVEEVTDLADISLASAEDAVGEFTYFSNNLSDEIFSEELGKMVKYTTLSCDGINENELESQGFIKYTDTEGGSYYIKSSDGYYGYINFDEDVFIEADATQMLRMFSMQRSSDPVMDALIEQCNKIVKAAEFAAAWLDALTAELDKYIATAEKEMSNAELQLEKIDSMKYAGSTNSSFSNSTAMNRLSDTRKSVTERMAKIKFKLENLRHLKILVKALPIVNLILVLREMADTFITLDILRDSALPCEEDQANAFLLQEDITKTCYSALLGIASVELFFTAIVMMSSEALPVALGAMYAQYLVTESMEASLKGNKRGFEYRLKRLKCNSPDDEDGGNGSGSQGIGNIQDPSGYVYEAVPSNRVEGVKAECYYYDYPVDDFGIPGENKEDIFWDAEEYDQTNPLITDKNGMYAWNVPPGEWLVKFSKDGYYDTDSRGDVAANANGYLPVPPPQTQVNTAIVSKAAPEVESVNVYDDEIQIIFSQYMQIDSVNVDNVKVFCGGQEVHGSITPENAEYDYENVHQYASIFKFIPDEELSETASVEISNVINYAGKALAGKATQSQTPSAKPDGISISANVAVPYNSGALVEIEIQPKEAGANKTLTITTSSPSIVGVVNQTITTDENGKATVMLQGNLPGTGEINISLDGTNIQTTSTATVGNVTDTSNACAKVTASIASGSTVNSGTQLTLTTATDGAEIYYTLDGTCPCVVENPARIKYTAPIAINEDSFIIAYAIKNGMEDSATAGFVYTVSDVVIKAEKPSASPAGGTVASGTSVTLTTGTDGASIYYTVDGSQPTEHSTRYSSPISITATTTIKAITVKVGMATSDVMTETYTVKSGSSGGGGVSRYTIKFETNGGSAVKAITVNKNAVATEPTAPTKDGFKFDGWYTDKELTVAYDFTAKVTKNVTLYAKWTEIEKEPVVDEPDTTVAFKDVKANDWFYANVQYVVENKLMNGVAEDKFAPNDTLTRAMLVTVLYRNAGEPATNRSIPFADVDMGAYYANAVSWAKQNGIVNGITENEFAPDNNITREQIATIMFRYAQYKGMDAVTLEENLHFTDADEISEFAVSAMNWAVGTGLMNGKSATTLNPKDNATRAEIAAILQRFIEANK